MFIMLKRPSSELEDLKKDHIKTIECVLRTKKRLKDA